MVRAGGKRRAAEVERGGALLDVQHTKLEFEISTLKTTPVHVSEQLYMNSQQINHICLFLVCKDPDKELELASRYAAICFRWSMLGFLRPERKSTAHVSLSRPETIAPFINEQRGGGAGSEPPREKISCFTLASHCLKLQQCLPKTRADLSFGTRADLQVNAIQGTDQSKATSGQRGGWSEEQVHQQEVILDF